MALICCGGEFYIARSLPQFPVFFEFVVFVVAAIGLTKSRKDAGANQPSLAGLLTFVCLATGAYLGAYFGLQ